MLSRQNVELLRKCCCNADTEQMENALSFFLLNSAMQWREYAPAPFSLGKQIRSGILFIAKLLNLFNVYQIAKLGNFKPE